MENEIPGSCALAAGSCAICKECTRPKGTECRYPEKMRYSIESLGGNVVQLMKDELGIEMKWAEAGKLPEFYVLVGGLLMA
jgi:predicted metal-binding protein